MLYITKSSQWPYEVCIIINPILQMRQLRLRKAEWRPSNQATILRSSQVWNPLCPKPMLLTLLGEEADGAGGDLLGACVPVESGI